MCIYFSDCSIERFVSAHSSLEQFHLPEDEAVDTYDRVQDKYRSELLRTEAVITGYTIAIK